MRHCSRPGCNAPAAAAFNFDGLRRIVWLNPIDPRSPTAGDLCATHADRLHPPVHWEMRDLRHGRAAVGDRRHDGPETPLLARAFRAAG